MFIKASGSHFKSAAVDLMHGLKETVNIRVEGHLMHMQVSELIVHDRVIEMQECDHEGNAEISVIFDQALQLIDERDSVYIRFDSDIMQVEQAGIRFDLSAVPVLHVDTDALRLSEDNAKLPKMALESFIKNTRALDEVTSVLKEQMPAIQVLNGTAYCALTNTVLIAPVALPDCALSGQAARRAQKILARTPCTYYSMSDRMMSIKASDMEAVTITTQRPMRQKLLAIKGIAEELKEVVSISLVPIQRQLEIVCRTYKKTNVSFSVCKDGVRVFVDEIKTRSVFGSADPALVTIQISTAQLSAITKLFGNESNIHVKKGSCLCLEQPHTNKKLLVSGMLF